MTRFRITLLVFAVCVLSVAAQAEERPPNIVLIVADDLGYNDISLHGNTLVRTPNIDAIGNQGVWFTRGHTTAPVCSPSRAGLLTGRHQQRFGFEFITGPPQLFLGLAGGEQRVRDSGGILVDIPRDKRIPVSEMGIPPSQTNLAELLKTNDYATGIFGKWHVGEGPRLSPPSRGFDESIWFTGSLYALADSPDVVNARLPWDSIDRFLWRMLPYRVSREGGAFTPKEYLTTFQARQSVRFIEAHQEKPFFLYLPFWAPHTPLQAPKDYYDRLSHIADHKTRVYYAMIECMDDAVGMVVDKLEELGLDDNTLVIFTSDNGAAQYTRITNTNQPFRGSKLNYYQGGVVVPYLMRWPKGLPPSKVLHHPVSLMDIYPTIAAATGTRLPEDETIDGVNLLPLANGETTTAPHEALVWRSGRYKAIWHGEYRLQVDENQDKVMLYNITDDVGERHNLAEDQPETVRKLRAILEKTMSQFADPNWLTPFYFRVTTDIWPDEPPDDAAFVYFPG